MITDLMITAAGNNSSSPLRTWWLPPMLLALTWMGVGPGHALPTSGRVVEFGTNLPIAGAKVTIQATTPSTTTDASGEFTIDIPNEIAFPVLAAGKFGYFNSGDYNVLPGDTDALLALRPIDATPLQELSFHDPINCAGCHSDHYLEWFGDGGEARPSRHSTAGQNRWVRDLYDGSGTAGGMEGYMFVEDSPILEESVNPNGLHRSGLCAECHLPSLASVAPVPGTLKLSDATAGSPLGSQEHIAYQNGIFCDLCHKLESVNDQLGRTAFFGNGILNKTDPSVQFGPLNDAVIEMPPVMAAAFNPLMNDSRACAPCHEYNMDHDFDNDFDEAGSPPGQTTFSEWENSSYAAEGITCQECHMPSPEESPVILCTFGGSPRPAQQRHSHRFEGTSPEFLERAVEVEIAAEQLGSELVVNASVTNVGAGHNFPTGVSIRNAMLVVSASTESGQPLSWLAGTDLIPTWGGVGEDANDYGNTPGRGYAKILRSHDNRERALFIDAIELVSNTQIGPRETDQSTYRFDLDGVGNETIRISAKIIYRRVWKDLGETKGWIGGVDGQGFPYEGDVLVESVSAIVEGVVGPPTPTVTPVNLADCDSGYYLLDLFGGRHPVGNPPLVTGGLYFGEPVARDLEWGPALAGKLEPSAPQELVVLDGAGAAHYVANPGSHPGQDFYFPIGEEMPRGRAVDLEMTPEGTGFYVLTDFGGIHRAGSALPMGEDPLLPNTGMQGTLGFDIPIPPEYRAAGFPNPGGASLRAVAFVTVDTDGDLDVDGFVVLDSMGGHYPFDRNGDRLAPGSARGGANDPTNLLDPEEYVWPYFLGLDIARDVEIHSSQRGVVILDGWGGLHPVPVDQEDNPVFFAGNRRSLQDPTPIQSVGMPYVVAGFDDPETFADESDGGSYGMDAASIFEDVEFATCEGGLYTLDKFGGVFALGTVRAEEGNPIPRFNGSPYFFPFQYGVDIEVAETEFGEKAFIK